MSGADEALPHAPVSGDGAQSCPVCGAPTRARFSLDEREVLVCTACGHGVLSPPPSDEELASSYATAYGVEGEKFRLPVESVVTALARRAARELAAGLPPECRRVLDVGCGRGLVLNALAEEGVACTGVERERDAAMGIDPRVELVVVDDLVDAKLPAASFGAVMFRHVLEHLRAPAAALREARRLLHPRGRLYAEVPDFGSTQARVLGRFWFHLDPPRHLHQFTRASVTRMIEDAGFVVEDVHVGGPLHDVMGWLQSGLNAAGRPSMALYDGLHAGARLALRDIAGTALLGPGALALGLLERATGGGAAVAVRARPGP